MHDLYNLFSLWLQSVLSGGTTRPGSRSGTSASASGSLQQGQTTPPSSQLQQQSSQAQQQAGAGGSQQGEGSGPGSADGRSSLTGKGLGQQGLPSAPSPTTAIVQLQSPGGGGDPTIAALLQLLKAAGEGMEPCLTEEGSHAWHSCIVCSTDVVGTGIALHSAGSLPSLSGIPSLPSQLSYTATALLHSEDPYLAALLTLPSCHTEEWLEMWVLSKSRDGPPTPEQVLAGTAFKQDAWRHLVAMLCKCCKNTNLQVRAARACSEPRAGMRAEVFSHDQLFSEHNQLLSEQHLWCSL
jgi:hypothetical protein